MISKKVSLRQRRSLVTKMQWRKMKDKRGFAAPRVSRRLSTLLTWPKTRRPSSATINFRIINTKSQLQTTLHMYLLIYWLVHLSVYISFSLSEVCRPLPGKESKLSNFVASSAFRFLVWKFIKDVSKGIHSPLILVHFNYWVGFTFYSEVLWKIVWLPVCISVMVAGFVNGWVWAMVLLGPSRIMVNLIQLIHHQFQSLRRHSRFCYLNGDGDPWLLQTMRHSMKELQSTQNACDWGNHFNFNEGKMLLVHENLPGISPPETRWGPSEGRVTPYSSQHLTWTRPNLILPS